MLSVPRLTALAALTAAFTLTATAAPSGRAPGTIVAAAASVGTVTVPSGEYEGLIDVAISRATLDVLYSRLEGDRDDFMACAADFNMKERLLITGTNTVIQFLSEDAYETDMREAGFEVSVDPGAINISTGSRIELKKLHEEWKLGSEEKYLQPYGPYPTFWPFHPYDSVDPLAYISTHFLPGDRKSRDYLDDSKRRSMSSDHKYKYEPRCSLIDIVAVQIGVQDAVQADLMNIRLGRLGVFPSVSCFYSSKRYVGIHLNLQEPLPASSVVDTRDFRIRRTWPNGAVIEIGEVLRQRDARRYPHHEHHDSAAEPPFQGRGTDNGS